MASFADTVFAYPTALYTALLGVVLFYWLLALVGVVDFESGDWELDLQADSDVDSIGALAGFVVAFGLNGVPFSVALSLLVLAAWTVCSLAAMWLLPLVPTAVLGWIAGTAVLLASFALALPITARLVRPLRGLFVTHNAVSNAALVGQPCRVVTQTVSESFGRAEIARRGASINVSVRARTPNSLAKGSTALVLEYDQTQQIYWIEAAPQ